MTGDNTNGSGGYGTAGDHAGNYGSTGNSSGGYGPTGNADGYSYGPQAPRQKRGAGGWALLIILVVFASPVILGIGINVYPPESGFPEDIRETAGSVFDGKQNDGKNRLAAGVLNYFFKEYERIDRTDYVEKYRAKSFVVGKEITILSPSGNRQATALDVDQDCHLIVRYENGQTERLSSGEISIRLS